MSREVFEAFAGQQARFGYSQAVAVGDSTMVEVSRLGLPQAKVEISVIARKDV